MAAEELPLAESNHHHQKTETEWQWLIETGVADNIEITSQTNRFSLFISFYTISPVDDIFHPPAQLNQPV